MMENVREEYFLFLQFLNLSFVPGLAQQTVTPVPSSRLPSSAENITIHSWEHKTRWRPLFTTKTTIQAQLGTQNKMAAIIHYKEDNLGTVGNTNKMAAIIHYKDDHFETSRWRPLFIIKTTILTHQDGGHYSLQRRKFRQIKMAAIIHYKDDNFHTSKWRPLLITKTTFQAKLGQF